eukprot:SAG31_NODE_21884_length_538_cov_1.489749_2_plen_107_part_01
MLKPHEKSRLPWYEAAAEHLLNKYVSEYEMGGLVVTDKMMDELGDVVRSRLGGLQTSTENSYRGKWIRWETFARSRGMLPIPVTTVPGTHVLNVLWKRYRRSPPTFG